MKARLGRALGGDVLRCWLGKGEERVALRREGLGGRSFEDGARGGMEVWRHGGCGSNPVVILTWFFNKNKSRSNRTECKKDKFDRRVPKGSQKKMRGKKRTFSRENISTHNFQQENRRF